MKRTSFLLVLLSLAIALYSQSGPRYGGTLTMATRGDPPAGFDTMRTSSIALHQVGGAIFGPGNLVMRCRENMYAVCPYLATRWQSNPAFTEWTFTIRQGVEWHDGEPFTAEDVRFWLDLVFFGAEARNGAVRAPSYFSRELGDAISVEVLSFDRVRVIFAERNPHFLDILANPRFTISHPRHLMEDRILDGEVSLAPVDVGLVGLGPFRFDRYRRGSLVRVRRNDEYWERDGRDSLPYLDRIDYVIMPDPFAMDAAFRSGRIDGGARGQAHYLGGERRALYQQELGDSVRFAEMEGGNFRLAFNMLREGPWQDVRVRRAIALWIDKRAAIPAALGGSGWTTPDLGPPNIPVPRFFVNWPRFDREPLERRREEAVQLLADAGYEDGFSMGHLVRGINTAPGEFLKDQLAGIGIDLELQIVDEGEWNRARVSADYDTQQGRLTPSPIPEGTESVYGRYSSNPDAYAKHEDPQVDALYDRLRLAISQDSRVQIWRELERYLFVEQTYIVPIAESINVVPYRSYVRGLAIPTEDAHTFNDHATVWMDRR